jgi:hypothetical protein
MTHVFETRVIEIDKTGFWKANLERVSEWRKGIAVARYYKSSIKPSWMYFLIDKDYNYLYEKSSWNEDAINGAQIERVFGGYYVVRDVKLDGCRTFPGQDRDTEYYYSTCIKDIIDENGAVLSEEEKKEYLKQNSIKLTTEYGENIVECESSFYRLDTYQYLFSIPKTVKPIGFYKDGRFRVGIVSDYRDFYIVVKDKKITTVFDDKQIKFIEKLLGIDIEKEDNSYSSPRNKYMKQSYSPVHKKPEETENIEVIEPEVIVEINNYLSTLSVPYGLYGQGRYIYDENYGIKRFLFLPETCYYYVDDEWRMIEGNVAQKAYEKIFEQHVNRPNYIQDVDRIADEIVLNGETYSIFRFKCRPYGFITKDGKFDYDFDVNNIQW